MQLDESGNTPLHVAVSMFDHSLVCLLLLKGADPNVPNRVDITPTALACRLGHTKILKTLRKHGGIATVMERKMIQSRIDKNVIALAAGPAEPMSATSQISNPKGALHSSNQPNSVRRTSNPRVNANTTPPTGTTIAMNRPTQPTIKTPGTPIPANSAVNTSTPSPKSVNDSDYINELGALVRSFPRSFFTPENAAWLGGGLDSPILSTILNFKDSNGWTPLMKAAYKGHADVVRGLISRGANAKEFDNAGCTALVWGCLGGHEDVVEVLLNEGQAPVNAFLESAKFKLCPPPTPLIAACFAGNLNIVNRLLEADARVDFKVGPGSGKSALMIACWMRRLDIAQLLIERNATLECTTKNTEEWVRRGVAIVKRVSRRGILSSMSEPSNTLGRGPSHPPKNLPALSQDEADVVKKIAEFLKDAKAGAVPFTSLPHIASSLIGHNVVKRKRAKNDPQFEVCAHCAASKPFHTLTHPKQTIEIYRPQSRCTVRHLGSTA